jgi:hypothetical protein
MSFSYLTSTDVGKMRLLIPDTNPAAHVFEDEELDACLGLEGGRVKRAAALALETMASNEAYTQKAIRLLDLSTDGPKVAAELRARAKSLREQDAADALTEQTADGYAGFEVAEWPLGPASDRDYLERRGAWGWWSA